MTGMDKRCLKHDLDITVDTWKYLFYFKLSQNIFVPWVYVKIKQCALMPFSSGNTWLRYLIESASGYFSGSMYR